MSFSPLKIDQANSDINSFRSRLDNAAILEEENRLLLETTKVIIDLRNIN